MGFSIATTQIVGKRPSAHQRAPFLPHRASGGSTGLVDRLQRQVGNRAISSLLRTPIVRPKLSVSHPDDEHEREADRVADQVMRMAAPDAPTLQRSPLRVLRKCSECEEEKKLQRHPAQFTADPPQVSSNLQPYLDNSRGSGHPLSGSARSFFEPRLGQDLTHVRVHTDSRAAEASKEISAHAFTTGSDIYFAQGQYRPGTYSGDRLIGHELTHVLQQGRGSSLASLLRKATTDREYSRGNDDQYECCYETGQIRVELQLDTKTCDKKKSAKVPAVVNYSAVLGGKTHELDNTPSKQPATEGLQHKLVEVGSKNQSKLTTASKKKGAAPGMILSGSVKVQNDTTCDGKGTDSGCVEVTGPRGVQQQIKWTTEGKDAKSIEAVQLSQPQEEGTNRISAGLPLLASGGYPNFASAQPRHKDCWCDPKTGYHLNYSDGAKCPASFFVGAGVDPTQLPDGLAATKPRPKTLPTPCAAQSADKKICGDKK